MTLLVNGKAIQTQSGFSVSKLVTASSYHQNPVLLYLISPPLWFHSLWDSPLLEADRWNSLSLKRWQFQVQHKRSKAFFPEVPAGVYLDSKAQNKHGRMLMFWLAKRTWVTPSPHQGAECGVPSTRNTWTENRGGEQTSSCRETEIFNGDVDE